MSGGILPSPLPKIFECDQEEVIMAITRWDPFREVQTLQSRVNSLFRDMNGDNDPLAAASFVPPVDIYEDDKKVVIKLEVPGIDEKDLDVRMENHTLTVKGERKFDSEEKEQNFHRIERRYGSFFRAFTLPSTVDSEHIKADYHNGVLRLELAKKPEAQPKQIKVNVAA
jgi:HSP20 family protein